MIGYLKGTIEMLGPETCFIDVQGVGYRVFTPASTRERLAIGVAARLYTYLNVREDALLLFGFVTQEEHDMFISLLSVTGVGPKMALSILSGMKPEGIRVAIGQKNLTALTRISGVGKKTAERIVLELRDKIGQIDAEAILPGSEPMAELSGNAANEAQAALISLGYSPAEILPRLKKYSGSLSSTEELIRAVLRDMGGR